MARYIDADAFKDFMDMTCDAGGLMYPVVREIKEYVKKQIDGQPTADVRENVHGEWAKICWKAFRCSECKNISEYYTDFCPNCGADMRKGEANGFNQQTRCD